MRTNIDKKKKVILRSKLTGEVTEFDSRDSLMKALQVNVTTIYKFLRGDKTSILGRYFEVISK